MMILQLKSLFLLLLFMSSSLCVADTTIVDIGLKQQDPDSGPHFAASKPADSLSKNTTSELAEQDLAGDKEEDCD